MLETIAFMGVKKMSDTYSPDELERIGFLVSDDPTSRGALMTYDRHMLNLPAIQETMRQIGYVDVRARFLIEAAPHLLDIAKRQVAIIMQLRASTEVYKTSLLQLGVSADYPAAVDSICGQMEEQLLAAIRATEVGAAEVMKEIMAEGLTSKKT